MKHVASFLAALALVGCGSRSTTGGGTTTSPPEPSLPRQEGLPAAVETTRQAIYAAATQRDFRALRRLIPASRFTFSYGQTGPGGAVGYWRRLEENGEQPFDTMAALLELRYTKSQAAYVWPWAYDRDPAKLSPREIDELVAAGAATKRQLEQMADYGQYLGWRLGIRPDGTWIFFVAGD